MTLNVVCNNTAVNLYVKKQVFICTCSKFQSDVTTACNMAETQLVEELVD
jgi:hypothetical protein